MKDDDKMEEHPNDHKSDMPQEYAKRIDEALASLSNKDRILIDGVRFEILKDVNGQDTTNASAPSVMRPDEARVEGLKSPAEANQ